MSDQSLCIDYNREALDDLKEYPYIDHPAIRQIFDVQKRDNVSDVVALATMVKYFYRQSETRQNVINQYRDHGLPAMQLTVDESVSALVFINDALRKRIAELESTVKGQGNDNA